MKFSTLFLSLFISLSLLSPIQLDAMKRKAQEEISEAAKRQKSDAKDAKDMSLDNEQEDDGEDGGEEEFFCSLCNTEQPGADTYILPCGDAYHTDCLDGWKKRGHDVCPDCNYCFREKPASSEARSHDQKDVQCPICKKTIDASSKRKLICSHEVHDSCMKGWLKDHVSCPVKLCGTVIKERAGAGSDSKESCAICQDTENYPKRKELLCGHRFHKECIELWFKEDKITCPLCHKEVRKREAPAAGASSSSSNGQYQGVQSLEHAQRIFNDFMAEEGSSASSSSAPSSASSSSASIDSLFSRFLAQAFGGRNPFSS